MSYTFPSRVRKVMPMEPDPNYFEILNQDGEKIFALGPSYTKAFVLQQYGAGGIDLEALVSLKEVIEDLLPRRDTSPLAQSPLPQARCEVCDAPVREGMRFCSGLEGCFLTWYRRQREGSR